MADATPDTKPAAEVKDVKPVTAGDEDDHVDASKLKLPEGVQLAQAPENKGEDEEETLFKQLCKMYRFVKGEWKERGTGDVKILQHKGHKKVRLVMREDRTFNVRANHLIDPEANLEANAGSDRGWVWRAMDFSDGEFKEEVFAIRFKETSTADEFKAAFVNAQGVNKKLAEGAGGESKPEAAAEAEKPEAAAAADSVDKVAESVGEMSVKEGEKPAEAETAAKE